MDVQKFIENLPILAEAPGGIKRLRGLVLDLAVRGELTDQMPEEGTGESVLNANLQEADRLLSEGVIRKEKALQSSSDADFPFVLPPSWKWCKIGQILSYNRAEKRDGKSLPPEAWVLGMEDIERDSSILLEKKTAKVAQPKSSLNCYQKGDVLYGKLRPYLNKVLIADAEGYCSTEIVPLRPYTLISSRYFLLTLKRSDFLAYVSSKLHGINLPRLGTEDARNAFIPLPPLAEQKRIVEQVDRLMAFLDDLEAKQKQKNQTKALLGRSALEQLELAQTPTEAQASWHRIATNAPWLLATPENLKRLRQTILQLAVQGKLVRQDLNDDNKLNRQSKSFGEIETRGSIDGRDPVPFRPPKNWIWVKFHQVISLQHGHQFREYDFVPAGIPVVKIGQCKADGSLDLTKCHFIDNSRETEFSKFLVHKGDILMALTGGTLGKLTVVDKDYGLVVQNYRVGKFIPDEKLYERGMVSLLLESFLFQKLVQDKINQNAQPNIGKDKIEQLWVPLPPLPEQKRIVAKVQSLLTLLDQAEAALTKRTQTAELLTRSACEHILEAC